MSGLVTRLQKQAERGTYIPDGPKLILEAIAELESLRSRLAEAERDAALGRIAIKFVDRAGDYCAVDPPGLICSEFHAAMAAEVERQFQERMQRDATASTVSGEGER